VFLEGTKHWEYCQTLLNVEVSEGMRVLDAGCSRSVFPLYLAKKYKCSVVGVDNATCDRYKLDRKLGGKFGLDVEYIQADLRSVDLPDGYFDVSFCISVLEHVKSSYLGMDELIRLTKPGGVIGITTDFVPKGKPLPVTGAYNEKQIRENFINRSGVGLRGELDYDYGSSWEKYCKRVNSFFSSVRLHTAVNLTLDRI